MACYLLDLIFETTVSAFALRAAAATSFVTTVLPIGEIEIPASFKCCNANGIPIIVTKQAIAEKT